MLRITFAPSFTTTFGPSTVYGPILAPASIWQKLPMNAGPSICSRSGSCTPSPSSTLSRRRMPESSSSTLPSRASKFAWRYWSRLPMSCQ